MFSFWIISHEDVNLGLLPFPACGARISSRIKSTGLTGKRQKKSFGPPGPSIPEVCICYESKSSSFIFVAVSVVVTLKVIWVGCLVLAAERVYLMQSHCVSELTMKR